ncbi:Gfo/Idh/MocA family protein [Salinispirillum marinum]|uniref:Gfo/Idh/MocA family protein n=2 Tax=Saccharospirillaceae TaxID=255527 RepID=A0ABV8BB58_9GAMM
MALKNTTAPVRWGVLGSSGIVDAFMADLPYTQNMRVDAVCSRTTEGAQRFAQKYGTPHTFTDVSAMVQSGRIDALYIAVPHSHHKAAACTALRAGVAVLVEKPATITVAEWDELVALAQQNNTFLMEALWTDFVPGMAAAQQAVAEGKIGTLRSLEVSFGFTAPDDPKGRLLNPDLAGGALWDIGIYGLYHAWRWLGEPETWSVQRVLASTGVDLRDTVDLAYTDGRVARMHFALDREMPKEVVLHGTRGWLRISDIYNAARVVLGGSSGPEEVIYERLDAAGGWCYEMQHVTDCLQQGLVESPRWRWSDTRQMQLWVANVQALWGKEHA